MALLVSKLLQQQLRRRRHNRHGRCRDTASYCKVEFPLDWGKSCPCAQGWLLPSESETVPQCHIPASILRICSIHSPVTIRQQAPTGWANAHRAVDRHTVSLVARSRLGEPRTWSSSVQRLQQHLPCFDFLAATTFFGANRPVRPFVYFAV